MGNWQLGSGNRALLLGVISALGPNLVLLQIFWLQISQLYADLAPFAVAHFVTRDVSHPVLIPQFVGDSGKHGWEVIETLRIENLAPCGFTDFGHLLLQLLFF